MTRALFAACVLLSASPALAQIPAPGAQPAAAPGTTPRSITMTGCVGGQGSDAQPFMLNNAFVVPSGGANASGVNPPSVATAGSQPPATPPAVPPAVSPALPPPASPTPPTQPPVAGTAGTAPTAGSAGTAGTAGSAGTAGTAGGASTAAAGSVGATPAASATADAAMHGYRLSGSDMKAWAGQRVEIVGSLVNANPTTPGTTPAAPEFRVQSVRPVSGPCPQ